MKRKYLIFALVFLLFPSFAFASVDEGVKNKPSQEQKEKLLNTRLPFIKNNGQVNKEVKYYADTFAGRVFITEKDITYSLRKIEGSDSPKTQSPEDVKPSRFEGSETKQKLSAIKETLIGATLKPEASIKSKAKVNYLKGNAPDKWKTNIPTYDELSLGDVYKDIGLKLKAYGSNIEKIFEIRKDAEVSDIKINIQGAKGLNINKHGELEIETELGIVKMTKPVAYQEIDGKRVDVIAKYAVYNSESFNLPLTFAGEGWEEGASELAYGFQIGDYNKDIPLIIDPLVYSTFLGGSGWDMGYGIAVDSSGDAYVTGYTSSLDFPTTSRAYERSYNGNWDAFVTKLNADGTELVYSTFLGGSSEDRGFGIAVDSSGNAYVTGYTESSDFPTTEEAYDWSYNGKYDAFVSKLNADGSGLIYSTFLGGSSYEHGYGIAVDLSGNAYVTGTAYYSSDFPTTPGVYDTNHNGDWDAFVAKISTETAPSTPAEVVNAVDTMLASGEISSAAIANSIVSQLSNAQENLATNPTSAENILNAVINFIEAQSGKKITTQSAETLIGYLTGIINGL